MEIMDIVDGDDNVVRQAAREDVYKHLLQHRIVHVLVFDKFGRMCLQKRAKHLSFCPDHWSTAVGGHVKAGESYDTAAKRESREEIGTELQMNFFKKILYNDPRGMQKFLGIFVAKTDKELIPADEDVAELDFFDFKEIGKMLKSEKFHPELRYILENYSDELKEIKWQV